MKKRKIEIEGFPQVWKNAEAGYVIIIYRDHSELYQFKSTWNNTEAKKQDTTYDPYNEIEMEKGNGGKRVHGKKTIKVIDFTR